MPARRRLNGPRTRRALPRASSSSSPTARARCRSARSPSGSTLPKSGAHRLLATLVDLGWAEQDPDTSFYRLTMRLAVLGQRFYVATGIPDICQPVLDRFAAATAASSRGSPSSTATRWCGSRTRRARSGGLVYQPSLTTNTGAAVRDRERQGVARDAAPRAGAMQHRAKQGGFERCRPLRAERHSLDRRAAARDRATARRGYGLAVNEAEPGVTARRGGDSLGRRAGRRSAPSASPVRACA